MRHVLDEEGNPWFKDELRRKQLNSGVPGVHACLPFQCEQCWVRNLEGRDPGPWDEAYTMSIRRVNLDAMAGKSRHTIAGHRQRTSEIVRNALRINQTPILRPRGPFPVSDTVGMGLGVAIVQKSLVAVGKNEETVQPDTLRQLRSTYTKSWDSSPEGVMEAASFAKGTGRVRPTSCPSQSEFYLDAWRGLETRMGHKSKANHALSMAAMVQAITYVKEQAMSARDRAEANYMWKFGAYLTISTAAGLRGHEGFYLDLAGVRKYLARGKEGTIPDKLRKDTILTEEQCERLPFVVLPLLGKFKGSLHVDHHLINLANTSLSGLEPRWWLEKLVEVCASEGRVRGPAFATTRGELIEMSDFDASFRLVLHEVQDQTELISKDDDVDSKYGINRTPRKTATSRAKRAGYDDKLDEMFRWNKVEAAQNRRQRLGMSMLYSEAVLMMPTTWHMSYAL
jgi:hypothetical protein